MVKKKTIPKHYTVTNRMTLALIGSDESRFNVSLTVRDKVTRLSTDHSL